jgi:Tfp pilus assembly protein PilV
MTLLEVLVACGILVVGLASIAAMLPAAGSRLGQAALEDRAGNLAGNALAQARSAGAIAADVFSNPNRAVSFGRGARRPPRPSPSESTRTADSCWRTRCSSPRRRRRRRQ